MAWTDAHHAFAVEMCFFFKTGESVIATHTAFCAHYLLLWNYDFSGRKSIRLWVEKSQGHRFSELKENHLQDLKVLNSFGDGKSLKEPTTVYVK